MVGISGDLEEQLAFFKVKVLSSSLKSHQFKEIFLRGPCDDLALPLCYGILCPSFAILTDLVNSPCFPQFLDNGLSL